MAYLHDPKNKQDRERCKTDRAYAKDLYARIGEVSNIPQKTEFRVYEKLAIEPRDSELAILLLPDPKLPIGSTNAIDVTQIYRCTWDPWSSLENQVRK